MSTQPATLVTQDMVDRKNKFSDPRVAPPIALADIRKCAIAVYWPENPPPLYWDEDYGTGTKITPRRPGTAGSSPRWTSIPSHGPWTGNRPHPAGQRHRGQES